jgi:O-antigen/teichoic acid export membrane protein
MTSPSQIPNGHLTSGRLLARNTVWNLIGNGAPMIVAVVCIPLLIRGLGKDRFGVLTLAWVLIGYASLFDLGLGRALTQLVARKLGAGEGREIPSLAWTSLLLMLLLGFVGTASILLISPWLAGRGLNVPAALQKETLQSFRLLGLSIPFVITTAGLRGLLEAHQRFGLVNSLRIPMGVLTFAGPLFVLPFSRSVVAVVATLVGGRIVVWAAHLLVCLRVMPGLRRSIACERAALGSLLRFGGWMTVTNIVGPLITYLDRFIIGSMISVRAVAYYTTPSEVVSNLGLIPGSITGVLFPAFAANFRSNHGRAKMLFIRGVKYTFLTLFPITFLIMVFAQEGLQLWLGNEFAEHSFRVLQWLAFGRLLNSLALMPFALVQGAGHPDFTGKLHLIELPFYLTAVWWLTGAMGIEGAAIAWVARVAVDTVVLFVMAQRLMHYGVSMIWEVSFGTGLTVLALALAVFPMETPVKLVFVFVTLFIFVVFAWPFIRQEANKKTIFSLFGRSAKAVEQAE